MQMLMQDRRRGRGRRAAGACAALLIIFAAVSYSASTTKSATYDEPMHALGAWIHLHHRDFRINFEDPPLWHYWAALPNGRDALEVDWSHPLWDSMQRVSYNQWPFTALVLYQTVGNEGDAFVQRSRAMMMALAVGLGVLLAWWSWRIGGAVAAVVATAGFALDPTLLAHAPLVKNDVAMGLAMLAVAVALWQVGRRATLLRIVITALLVGAAVNLKFSAILLGPIVLVVLGLRAWIGGEWRVLRWNLTRWPSRLAAGMGMVLLCGVVAYGCIWATYGFRFAAIPGSPDALNTQAIRIEVARYSIEAKQGRRPNVQQVVAWQPDLFTRAVDLSLRHRLLPEPWLNGLLFVHARSFTRSAFLMGEHSSTGWWYYFPLALLFKSATATILAAAVALGMWLRQRLRREREDHAPQERLDQWTTVCLLVPPAIYTASAMSSNLNIGVRHMLPVLPFVYVTLGLGIGAMIRRGKRGRIVAGALAAGLAIEVLVAWPNYIAFFNVPSGGLRGGVRLLSDSNLDWGQDLPALARWQSRHPEQRLYFGYFGIADPAYYGIDYINVAGGYAYGREKQPITEPGVLALSATVLQGTYGHPDLYRWLREDGEPMDVLNGTIYLYYVEPAPGGSAD